MLNANEKKITITTINKQVPSIIMDRNLLYCIGVPFVLMTGTGRIKAGAKQRS